MDSTISTKDLKSKLDKKQRITVVETLAPGASPGDSSSHHAATSLLCQGSSGLLHVFFDC
jgi:hypothetical protein